MQSDGNGKNRWSNSSRLGDGTLEQTTFNKNLKTASDKTLIFFFQLHYYNEINTTWHQPHEQERSLPFSKICHHSTKPKLINKQPFLPLSILMILHIQTNKQTNTSNE